jgi:hypothetical protein
VKEEVEAGEKQALADAEPNVASLFHDIYVPGSEPSEMRGRVPEETQQL